MTQSHGGDLIARVLKNQGVPYLFTLIGGHISPILVGAKQLGIRVIDVRHEATAVFAADATARLTGIPGVAVVTAGPGVTNTVTAVKNAQVAQSPVVLIGGAAPTVLRGRGALQDVEQIPLLKSAVKWATSVKRVRDLIPAMEEAFRRAQEGVPGPVFVETPVDLLYPEQTVRELYSLGKGKSLGQKAVNAYLNWHVNRLFAGKETVQPGPAIQVPPPPPDPGKTAKIAARLRQAQRPIFVIGSQVLLDVAHVDEVVAAVERIGAPVYLSGMARGMLGRDHPLQMRHKRRMALKEADFVLLAGVPCDFRMDYGRHFRRSAFYAAANRSKRDLTMNRKPDIGVLGDPGAFLRLLASHLDPDPDRWAEWIGHLRERDENRNDEIRRKALEPTNGVNPLHLFLELDQLIGPDTVLVADGGDFVATAAYILQPPGPLRWLDPGPFGTLGVGAGFALAAKLHRPEADVWVIYGDGSFGYSLIEFDTFYRHSLPVTALVGNDASWAQIAREQIPMFGDDVATALRHADYHLAAAGLGAAGLKLEDPELAEDVLREAKEKTRDGQPVVVNTILGKSDFRKGSISM
ncbi:MAG TPA: thiamine pyrophosphate-binding protein [Anaerolineae bacterium]|nr:thiamine pyrophosphate-binding protein [Anaerolineae bacterium]